MFQSIYPSKVWKTPCFNMSGKYLLTFQTFFVKFWLIPWACYILLIFYKRWCSQKDYNLNFNSFFLIDLIKQLSDDVTSLIPCFLKRVPLQQRHWWALLNFQSSIYQSNHQFINSIKKISWQKKDHFLKVLQFCKHLMSLGWFRF